MKNHPYMEQYNITAETLRETTDTSPKVESNFLREYIRYAREKCHPELSDKYLS